MDELLLQSLSEEFDCDRYPSEFLAEYEPMECLAHNEAGETLLVKSKQTGVRFVTKCYTAKDLLSHTSEGTLLMGLTHPGLPAFMGEYQNDKMLCVVREYIEGTPLNQYAAPNNLSQAEIISIAVQLTDILCYLHRQTPPIIHRDIKPHNVIIDNKGKVWLIDFGISRVYNETAKEDTVCFGTKQFAAPEQYGFSQTDCRADVFSFGILLGWLLTGATERKLMLAQINNPRLRRLIARCTEFAPEKRHQSMARVKRVLQNADGSKNRRCLRRAAGILACGMCLCIGFTVGRYTELAPPLSFSSHVSFEEPLIEQAVRLALDKTQHEPIDEAELLSVSELYLFGNHAVANLEDYMELGQHMANNDGVVKNGEIRSLRDISRLKNLKCLRIALQNIEDLSPLCELAELEQLDLKHNPIADVEPISSLPAIQMLCVFDTRISDLSSLSACPTLENLDIGNTRIQSLSALAGLKKLKYLYMRGASLQALSGIEQFVYLEQVGLDDVADGDLTPLLSLPRLKEAHLGEALRQSAQHDLSQAGFSVLYQ